MQRNWLKMNIQNFLRISHVQWVTGNVVSVQHLMLHVEANQGVTGNVVSVQQRKMNIQNFLPISHVQWVTGNVVSVQHLMLHVEANQGITRKMSTNVFTELSPSLSWNWSGSVLSVFASNETVNSTPANQHGRTRNQARIGASIAARPQPAPISNSLLAKEERSWVEVAESPTLNLRIWMILMV